MQQDLKFKITAAVGTLAFLIFAASYQSVPVKSLQQSQFEQWLSAREEQSRLAPSAFEASPAINLRILSTFPTHPLSITLSSKVPGEKERVFRVLELMREANLLSKSTWQSHPASWAGISFVVESGKNIFKTQIDQKQASASVQVRTLLKLLQYYVVTPLPTPTAPPLDEE